MEVLELLTGRSARILRVTHPNGNPPLPVLLTEIQRRYQFLKVPDLDKLLEERTAIFESGRFNDHEVKRVITGDGFFACDVHGSTNLADELADDIENWVTGELGYRLKPDGVVGQAYGSEIEFFLPAAAASRATTLLEFGPRISARVRSYGNQTPDFRLEHIGFQADASAGSQTLKTVGFIVERRANSPSQDIWYSAAPLKTDEHIETLKQFSTILS